MDGLEAVGGGGEADPGGVAADLGRDVDVRIGVLDRLVRDRVEDRLVEGRAVVVERDLDLVLAGLVTRGEVDVDGGLVEAVKDVGGDRLAGDERTVVEEAGVAVGVAGDADAEGNRNAVGNPAEAEAVAGPANGGVAGRGGLAVRVGVEGAVAGGHDDVALGIDRRRGAAAPKGGHVAVGRGVEEGHELERASVVADEPTLVRLVVVVRGEGDDQDTVGVSGHVVIHRQARALELPQCVELDHAVLVARAGAGHGERGVVDELAVGIDRRGADRDRAVRQIAAGRDIDGVELLEEDGIGGAGVHRAARDVLRLGDEVKDAGVLVEVRRAGDADDRLDVR